MITEDRLLDAMAACRGAITPPADFLERLDRRAEQLNRRRRMRATIAAVAVVVVLAGAVLTIQRDRSSDGVAARLKQNFVAQAGQICDHAIQRVKAARPSGDAAFADRLAAGQRAAVVDQAAIAALRSLPPPPSDRATVNAVLAQFDQSMGASLVVMAILQANGGQRGSPEVMAAINAASKAITEAAQLARDYGVARCAEMIYPAAY